MSEIKLLPCPFCGGEAINYFLNGVWLTECNSSKCIGAKISCGYRSKEDAIKAWNTRKPIDAVVEQLEQACFSPEGDYPGFVIDAEQAVDIVRGGRE